MAAKKADSLEWFHLAISGLHAHGEQHFTIRVLVGRRNQARGTKTLRSLSMMIAHERRRLVAAGCIEADVLKLIDFWDTRRRCSGCGRAIAS